MHPNEIIQTMARRTAEQVSRIAPTVVGTLECHYYTPEQNTEKPGQHGFKWLFLWQDRQYYGLHNANTVDDLVKETADAVEDVVNNIIVQV